MSILRLVVCCSVLVLMHVIRLLYRYRDGVVSFVSLSFARRALFMLRLYISL